MSDLRERLAKAIGVPVSAINEPHWKEVVDLFEELREQTQVACAIVLEKAAEKVRIRNAELEYISNDPQRNGELSALYLGIRSLIPDSARRLMKEALAEHDQRIHVDGGPAKADGDLNKPKPPLHIFTDADLAEHNAQIEKSVFDKAIKQVNSETLAVNLYLAEALEKRDVQVRAEAVKGIGDKFRFDKMEAEIASLKSALAEAQQSYEASHRHHVICLEQRNALQGALRELVGAEKARHEASIFGTHQNLRDANARFHTAIAAATALLEDK